MHYNGPYWLILVILNISIFNIWSILNIIYFTYKIMLVCLKYYNK